MEAQRTGMTKDETLWSKWVLNASDSRLAKMEARRISLDLDFSPIAMVENCFRRYLDASARQIVRRMEFIRAQAGRLVVDKTFDAIRHTGTIIEGG